jgi:hypothetical protein
MPPKLNYVHGSDLEVVEAELGMLDGQDGNAGGAAARIAPGEVAAAIRQKSSDTPISGSLLRTAAKHVSADRATSE